MDEGPSDLTDETLRAYFSPGKHAPRKHASELRAYRELREQFTEEEIALCLDYLTRKGVPGTGEICHSPMAFLANAITGVLSIAEAEQIKSEERVRRIESEHAQARQKAEELLSEEETYRRKEAVFVARYPNPVDQERAVLELSGGLRGFIRDPEVLRRAVIGAL